MQKLSKFLPVALVVAALVAVFVVLLCYESNYLVRVQELNLFLYTPLFFKQQLVVAGGLLTWLGTYFTQFFYHPWLGAILLCAWLGLLMWLIYKTFRLPRMWLPLLLIPVALVLLTDFDLGYWLYYLKLRGHFFICVMGTSLAVALTWLYRVVPFRNAFMVVAALLAYPVGGFYGLLAIVLMAVITWRIENLKLIHRVLTSVLALVLLVAVPLIYYRQVFYQASLENVWWQALPVYSETESFSHDYYPFVLLCVFLVVMALLYGRRMEPKFMRRNWQQTAAQLLLTGAVVWGCWLGWYKDVTFHEEIRMTNCVDHMQWEEVLKIMRQHKGDPTRMMVMYKNLALFKLGRAGNEMYTYRDGAQKPNCDFDLRMMQLNGRNIYLFYGLPNYCYRWCLEDGVEYGWRTEYLKFLVRCSLLNGEWQVARKYIDVLKQTRYHREWALQYEPLAVGEDMDAVKKHPELGPITRLMKGNDILASDQSLIEMFMLNTHAYRQTDDPVCAELVLLCALQLKDIRTFWNAFFQYAELHKGEPMPRHYQEAAFLYGNLEHGVDISGMPFDQSVINDYKELMSTASQYSNMTNEQMKQAAYPRFGHTFYYNYFFIRELATY